MKTKDIVPFDFNGNGITAIIDEEGNPWFIAKDVCVVLGFVNPRDAVRRHVKDHQKNSVVFHDGIPSPGNPNKIIINEGGLYRLVMRSKVPHAEAFQDWVTDEVLPAIRKTGTYSVAKMSDREKVVMFAKEVLVLDDQVKRLETVITENEPMVEGYKQFLDSKGLTGLSEAAKILGVGPRKFISAARNTKFLFKRGNVNYPKQGLIDSGRAVVKPVVDARGITRHRTYLTNEGIEFFRWSISKGLMSKADDFSRKRRAA